MIHIKELEKLQALCNVVNSRYNRGLNDDDQVKKMFDYEKKQDKAIIIVGYEDYQAISIEQLKEYQTLPKSQIYIDTEGNNRVKFSHNSAIYRAKAINN